MANKNAESGNFSPNLELRISHSNKFSCLINIVEQYLKKFDFDGITFQPYGYEAPVNFGNADLPPPSKGTSVKPKQQQK